MAIPRNWVDVSARNRHVPTVGDIITNYIKALGGKNVKLAKRGASVTYTMNGKRCRRWWTIGNDGSGLVVTLEPKLRR